MSSSIPVDHPELPVTKTTGAQQGKQLKQVDARSRSADDHCMIPDSDASHDDSSSSSDGDDESSCSGISMDGDSSTGFTNTDDDNESLWQQEVQNFLADKKNRDQAAAAATAKAGRGVAATKMNQAKRAASLRRIESDTSITSSPVSVTSVHSVQSPNAPPSPPSAAAMTKNEREISPKRKENRRSRNRSQGPGSRQQGGAAAPKQRSHSTSRIMKSGTSLADAASAHLKARPSLKSGGPPNQQRWSYKNLLSNLQKEAEDQLAEVSKSLIITSPRQGTDMEGASSHNKEGNSKRRTRSHSTPRLLAVPPLTVTVEQKENDKTSKKGTSGDTNSKRSQRSTNDTNSKRRQRAPTGDQASTRGQRTADDNNSKRQPRSHSTSRLPTPTNTAAEDMGSKPGQRTTDDNNSKRQQRTTDDKNSKRRQRSNSTSRLPSSTNTMDKDTPRRRVKKSIAAASESASANNKDEGSKRRQRSHSASRLQSSNCQVNTTKRDMKLEDKGWRTPEPPQRRFSYSNLLSSLGAHQHSRNAQAEERVTGSPGELRRKSSMRLEAVMTTATATTSSEHGRGRLGINSLFHVEKSGERIARTSSIAGKTEDATHEEKTKKNYGNPKMPVRRSESTGGVIDEMEESRKSNSTRLSKQAPRRSKSFDQDDSSEDETKQVRKGRKKDPTERKKALENTQEKKEEGERAERRGRNRRQRPQRAILDDSDDGIAADEQENKAPPKRKHRSRSLRRLEEMKKEAGEGAASGSSGSISSLTASTRKTTQSDFSFASGQLDLIKRAYPGSRLYEMSDSRNDSRSNLLDESKGSSLCRWRAETSQKDSAPAADNTPVAPNQMGNFSDEHQKRPSCRWQTHSSESLPVAPDHDLSSVQGSTGPSLRSHFEAPATPVSKSSISMFDLSPSSTVVSELTHATHVSRKSAMANIMPATIVEEEADIIRDLRKSLSSHREESGAKADTIPTPRIRRHSLGSVASVFPADEGDGSDIIDEPEGKRKSLGNLLEEFGEKDDAPKKPARRNSFASTTSLYKALSMMKDCSDTNHSHANSSHASMSMSHSSYSCDLGLCH